MLFAVSGIEVSPWIPPAVSFIISFFTSMGGVSGAFLILPFQVSVLGFNTPAVSATNQLYNVVAIPGGVYRYIKEGRMVWPLMWAVIIGTLPGVLIGAVIRIKYLPDPRNFKMFVGLVLLYIGSRIIKDLFEKNKKKSDSDEFKNLIRKFKGAQINSFPRVSVKKFNFSHMVYEFYGESYDVSTLKIMLLSSIVGVVGGIYGIGGGAIMAPFFVTFFRLPVYTVAGAALMGTFVTSFVGVIFYQSLSVYYTGIAVAPDWALGLLFGAGGIAGIYCGARMQKFMPSGFIKWLLAVCILFPAVKYIADFFIN